MKSKKYGIRGARGWSYSVVEQDDGNKFLAIEFSCPKKDLKINNDYLNQRFYFDVLENVVEAAKDAIELEGIGSGSRSYLVNSYDSENVRNEGD